MKNFRHFFREDKRLLTEAVSSFEEGRMPIPQTVHNVINHVTGAQTLEAVGSSLGHQRLPVPQTVNNVLNLFGSPDAMNPRVQSQILEWVFTKGLRSAVKKRFRIASYLSDKLGAEVTQDAVFSKAARKEIPGLADVNVDELWERFEGEPDTIPIVGGSRSKAEISQVSLQDVNAALEQSGLEGLHFGGSNGLMEYIEEGAWNVHGPYHMGSRYGKQGHDLSLEMVTEPDGRKHLSGLRTHDKDPSKTTYMFGTSETGGFIPPTDTHQWVQAIAMSQRATENLARYVQDVTNKDPNALDTADDEDIKRINSLVQQGALTPDKSSQAVDWAKQLGLGRATTLYHPETGIGEMKLRFPFLQDEEEDQKIEAQFVDTRRALEVALEKALRTPHTNPGWVGKSLHPTPTGTIHVGAKGHKGVDIPGLDEQPNHEANIPMYVEKLLDMFVNEPERTIATQFSKNVEHLGYHRNLRLDDLLRAGAEELVATREWTPEKAKARLDTFRQKSAPTMSSKTWATETEKNVDPNELMKQGWFPWKLDKSEFGPEGIVPSPQRTTLTMKRPGTESYIELRRKDETKPWALISPEGRDEVTPEEYEEKGYEIEALNDRQTLLQATKEGEDTVVLKLTRGRKGEPVWVRSTPHQVKEKGILAPLHSPMQLPVNVGEPTRLGFEDKNKSQALMTDFLENPEKYGDRNVTLDVKTKNGEVDETESKTYPHSLVSGVLAAAGKHETLNWSEKGEVRDEALQDAAKMLQQNIGNVSFKFGSASATSPTQRDAFHRRMSDRLQDYDEESAQRLANVAFQHAKQSGEIPTHEGGPIVADDDSSIRQDAYDALLTMGHKYRQYIAKSAGLDWIKRNIFGRKDKGGGAADDGERDELQQLQDKQKASRRKEVEDEEDVAGWGDDDEGEDFSDFSMSPEEAKAKEKQDQLDRQADALIRAAEEDPDAWAADAAANRARQAQTDRATVGAPVAQDGPANLIRQRVSANAPIADPTDSGSMAPAAAQKRKRYKRFVHPSKRPDYSSAPAPKAQPDYSSAPQPDYSNMPATKALPDYSNMQRESFLSFLQWREMAGTSAVYDGTVPKDGCGFNWWGAAGHPLGVSITGEPIKKKDKHGRAKKK